MCVWLCIRFKCHRMCLCVHRINRWLENIFQWPQHEHTRFFLFYIILYTIFFSLFHTHIYLYTIFTHIYMGRSYNKYCAAHLPALQYKMPFLISKLAHICVTCLKYFSTHAHHMLSKLTFICSLNNLLFHTFTVSCWYFFLPETYFI